MTEKKTGPSAPVGPVPTSLRESLRFDISAGFLVFLIALPLSLGISLACGYPAIAGIFTAVIGGIVGKFISDSPLAIKGPAAGLIVIAIGCITDLGYTGGKSLPADMNAYKLALAVGVAAGLLQIVLALFRAGILGEFFPAAAVHGMLAAIGVIIIVKQVPILLGVSASGSPFTLLMKIPEEISRLNPEVALIGGISFLILVLAPFVRNKYFRMVPAPMLVVAVSIPLGFLFDFAHDHGYLWHGHAYLVGQSQLVAVPSNLFNAMTFPDFSALLLPKAWKWVIMFTLIGSMESILSAKAIDLLDPWKRKTNLDRDLLAVGVGNTLAALIGGLPMISEIVRSRANVDNGARTRDSNFFHGVFLLAFVVLAPVLIHRIPLAALAAMLVYTGLRLAAPKEFFHVYKIGWEQFVVYLSTIVGVLSTDLLVGIGIGIAVELAFHLLHGAPLKALFSPTFEVKEKTGDTLQIAPQQAAVFSTWIVVRRKIHTLGIAGRKNIEVDLSNARVVDHSVMAKLEDLGTEFARQGLNLTVVGLDEHKPISTHPLALRRLVRGEATT